ncbi:DEAD/DEAH box helicase [Micromonospora chalcea]|uniref:DEAD/DEAH box helicase n=1 Tax=Micromonospora chalcea TaxID=1874 RepID=UPI0038282AAD
MFNRGIDALLQALPTISGLTVAEIRRLLTRAWLETTDDRLGADDQERTASPGDLRRLATALELHAIVPATTELPTIRACAFVAAEALMIAQQLAPLPDRQGRDPVFGRAGRFEHVEAGLLYLIAGYDANAALAARGLGEPPPQGGPEGPISEWALERIVDLVGLRRSVDATPVPPVADGASLRTIVRHEIWRRIGVHVSDHLDWLTFNSGANPSAATALRGLADQLEQRPGEAPGPATHADLHHLLLLLATACDGTAGRALRTVLPPPDDIGGRFATYQRERAATRPVLWPAAEEYARRTLPGPTAHAVVAVPTGSGKSSVAELAISQALSRGWVLYLAPTNALVGQIRRHTADVFGSSPVRSFIGGAEYTQLGGESLTDIEDRQVLVMTPEKCSLALRQNPEAFSRLALCVLDEAHLLADRGGRGVIAELVLAEVMHRAPEARLLLMSALVANPEALAEWLQNATTHPAVVVNEPWRPTRTLRAIAGVDSQRGNVAANEALSRLTQRPPSRKFEAVAMPIALISGLQGAWRSSDPADYVLTKTDIEIPLKVSRAPKLVSAGYCTPATSAVVQRLGERGDKVLAFLSRSKHDSFLAASTIQGFAGPSMPVDATVEAFLRLAELELGVPSALRVALSKRVAVHTSALLTEEQRASEVAFDRDLAVAMFATGTMAQGLNLPATAVVIGGTDIGYDQQATTQQRRDGERAQLLNAIGRAGRAHIAPRSLAIVVPNKLVVLESSADAMQAVRSAEFLQEEDASSAISSALDGLIDSAVRGGLGVETMSDAEQTAFTFLAFASENLDDARGVIGKTWAAHRANVRAHAEPLARTIGAVGREFIARAGVPQWVPLAAHQSGISLPETVRIYEGLRARLATEVAPSTILGWADLMLDLLESLPTRQLQRILPMDPYGTSRLAGIYEADPATCAAGWRAYRSALVAWMTGRPLIDAAESVHPRAVNNNAGRGQRDPLPRVIAVVGNGFRFGLSLIAGSLVATVATGREHDPDGPWNIPPECLRTLNLLPLAVRSGADQPEVLAWIRSGVNTRVAAHMLNALVPPPPGQSDDELQRWAYGRLRDLTEGAIVAPTTAHYQIIRALQAVRHAH